VLNESHIKHKFVLEDINNMLNTGDIPNLFASEDFIPLIDKIKNNAKRDGKLELIEIGTQN
jgi:dynein heavy chain